MSLPGGGYNHRLNIGAGQHIFIFGERPGVIACLFAQHGGGGFGAVLKIIADRHNFHIFYVNKAIRHKSLAAVAAANNANIDLCHM